MFELDQDKLNEKISEIINGKSEMRFLEKPIPSFSVTPNFITKGITIKEFYVIGKEPITKSEQWVPVSINENYEVAFHPSSNMVFPIVMKPVVEKMSYIAIVDLTWYLSWIRKEKSFTDLSKNLRAFEKLS